MEITKVNVCYNCKNRVKKLCTMNKCQISLDMHCDFHAEKCVSTTDLSSIEGAYDVFEKKMVEMKVFSINKTIFVGEGKNKFAIVDSVALTRETYRINFANFKNFVCSAMPHFVNGYIKSIEGSTYGSKVPSFKDSHQGMVDDLAKDIIEEMEKL